ncbi:carboxylesterase family protein [Streptomyces mirabilis]|uniref:carboxylesterase family protein n=1 Tax=Streptomyces mirabilis TaxID=68239 RepID=UPI0036CFEBAD
MGRDLGLDGVVDHFTRNGSLLDVPPTREAIAAVPTQALVAAQQQLRAEISAAPDPDRWGEAARNLMPFEPVVDGDLLPTAPIDAISAGAGAGVDLLIGTNTDEFRLFLVPTGLLDLIPEPALRATAAGYGLAPDTQLHLGIYQAARPGATPGELTAAIATDWFYRIPAIRLAEAHAHHQGAGGTHLYEFAWRPPTFDGRLGACHATELPFVFDNLHDQGFTNLIGTAPPQTRRHHARCLGLLRRLRRPRLARLPPARPQHPALRHPIRGTARPPPPRTCPVGHPPLRRRSVRRGWPPAFCARRWW